jgi:hypothetical protein
MKDKDYGAIIWGAILITAGIIFLLSNVYGFSAWQIIGTYWPLILVFIGGWIVLKEWKKR